MHQNHLSSISNTKCHRSCLHQTKTLPNKQDIIKCIPCLELLHNNIICLNRQTLMCLLLITKLVLTQTKCRWWESPALNSTHLNTVMRSLWTISMLTPMSMSIEIDKCKKEADQWCMDRQWLLNHHEEEVDLLSILIILRPLQRRRRMMHRIATTI